MITGVVNAQLEATILLVTHDATGQPHDVEVIVDTAYNGFLTLPTAQVIALGLPLRYQQQFRLPDGSIQGSNVYGATILWDGQPRTLEADEINAPPLVGTALLQGHELRVKFVVGGSVTIEAIP
jgi:predicted aspartyl protease